ncbi:sulfite exporter TauE/SafE family protein [Pseudoruegeria sp. SHC-113]|uniref:sulfite exporter TauE/SafE family protein n=1 Tax=Pseudoruegeria sp. SHC-113 TaxID=2855439 RepID=UPI0021BB1DF3|nr:sulfite exporter TauE/SafE family protein [Pseudoruegeria sp. SHC-113]MCT8160056.1 sulfite exporter TauE/SafE family protein [Pseudoruegeria sp. SHC-113]
MPELSGLVLDVIAAEGFALLCGAAILGGLVRGFAGFGTGLICVPLFALVLGPFETLTALIVMDLFGPLPNVQRALRDGHPPQILRLGLGLLVGLPAGVAVLALLSPEVFRYAVSLLALLMLGLLISGVRYTRALSTLALTATGGLGGFLAGTSGLPGPPVILMYMAGPYPAAAVRANTLLFLLMADVLMIGVLWLSGVLVPAAVLTGLALVLPYLLANVAGAAIFRPEAERLYRRVAYLLIAGAAIAGLPLWGM